MKIVLKQFTLAIGKGEASSGIGAQSVRKKCLLFWIASGQLSGKFMQMQDLVIPGGGLFSLDNHRNSYPKVNSKFQSSLLLVLPCSY